MVDYDVTYLVDLGFKQRLSKRLSYRIGPIIACPPCGNLGWHWSVSTTDDLLGNPSYHIKTPKNKTEVEKLLELFYLH